MARGSSCAQSVVLCGWGGQRLTSVIAALPWSMGMPVLVRGLLAHENMKAKEHVLP